MTKHYDLVSLGEPLLRMSPPHFGQLRRASSLEIFVVGSQLNVAANLARLGKSAAFVTRLPDNPLGLLALDCCRSYGLDDSFIKLVPGAKMGVTYVEFSAAPRAPMAVYDRAGSAAGTTTADDFDWDAVCSGARFVYTDGIFPGLSAGCLDATRSFLAAAKKHGCKVCFDVNYREHLWTPEQAKAAWSELLPMVDVLATNQAVSEVVFGFGGSDDDIMRRYAQDFGCEVISTTRREIIGLQQGAWNSRALVGGEVIEGTRRQFDIVDRYGTGDAWFAGFLYGLMECDVRYALDFGNAFGALAHTIEGDIAHLTPNDVEAVMGDSADLRVRR